MDGGGRLLRSLSEAALAPFRVGRPRLAGWPADYAAPSPALSPRPLTRRERRVKARTGFLQGLTRRGALGFVLTFGVLAATGLYGTVRSGDYAAFVASHGSPLDIAANAAGFSIRAITISGAKVLEPPEILQAAGIDPTRSLLFLNAAEVRNKLMAVPLVRDAVVTRLFPNRLTVTLEERDPVALWQKDGQLAIVSGDGVVIDTVKDDRFTALPFVVGEGANTICGVSRPARPCRRPPGPDHRGHLASATAAGTLQDGQRASRSPCPRSIPEPPWRASPRSTIRQAARQGSRVVDLRMPGRITVRLSEDAAARAPPCWPRSPSKVMPE